MINYLGFFLFLLLSWWEELGGNKLQLTSTQLNSMKGRKESSWSNVLNVCGVYFKDIQSLRYCIQLHIIFYKRRAFIFMFFLLNFSITWNWAFTELAKMLEHVFSFREMFHSDVVHLSVIWWVSLFQYYPKLRQLWIDNLGDKTFEFCFKYALSYSVKKSGWIMYCCYSSSYTSVWNAEFCLLK